MPMIHRLALLAALAIATPAAADPWPICVRGQPDTACVVDGDTVHYRGRKIRLIATDAPETEHASCPQERAAGERTRDRLAELLAAGVRVETEGREDRYGRLLARLVTPAGDVETILLDEGLTLPYRRSAEERERRREHWCGR